MVAALVLLAGPLSVGRTLGGRFSARASELDAQLPPTADICSASIAAACRSDAPPDGLGLAEAVPLMPPLALGASGRVVRPMARSSDPAVQRPESICVRAAVGETQPAPGEGGDEDVGEAGPKDAELEKARRGAVVAVAGRLARASDAAAQPAEPLVVIAAVGETHPAWGEGAGLVAVEAEAEAEVGLELGTGVAEVEVENERAPVGRFARSSDADRHPAEPVAVTDAVCESRKRKWSRSRPCLSLPRVRGMDVPFSATTPGGPRFIARSSDAEAQALVVVAAVPVDAAVVEAARRAGGARSLVDATTKSRDGVRQRAAVRDERCAGPRVQHSRWGWTIGGTGCSGRGWRAQPFVGTRLLTRRRTERGRWRFAA